MDSSDQQPVAGPNPYIGPRPFEDGETLYGREQEINELYIYVVGHGHGNNGTDDGLVWLLNSQGESIGETLSFDNGLNERFNEALISLQRRLVIAGKQTDPAGGTSFLILVLDTGNSY